MGVCPVAIQLYLQTEDKQMAELPLWLEDREGFTIDDKWANDQIMSSSS